MLGLDEVECCTTCSGAMRTILCVTDPPIEKPISQRLNFEQTNGPKELIAGIISDHSSQLSMKPGTRTTAILIYTHWHSVDLTLELNREVVSSQKFQTFAAIDCYAVPSKWQPELWLYR